MVNDTSAPSGAAPISTRTPAQATADALPTVQIDGIVWAQAVTGTGTGATVYAGGSFANARPAGAAPGTNLTPRANLLSYNISTGALNTSFAPDLNGQVTALATSPDGAVLYVGGDFTTADGVAHSKLAAYATATGKLISSFNPQVSNRVSTILATATTIYIGGKFASVNGVTRLRLAALKAGDGSLTAWAPTADYNVNAMVLTPDKTRLVVGGAFANLDNSTAYGLGELDATTGALYPWTAHSSVSTVADAGINSAIESLSTDGTSIFGTGYVYGTGGNLEGAFSADPTTGVLNWIEDCHGDTYSSYPMGGALYTVSHAHYCANIGGFPQPTPNYTGNMRHALAFTTAPAGTVQGPDPWGYTNWGSNPSPSLINWFPDFTVANVSGADQAAWSVTGNGTYLVVGGEFPTVNGTGQQGLARFAVKSAAPSRSGPRLPAGAEIPTLTASATAVRGTFSSNWDRDDKTLTYKVVRDGNTAQPVAVMTSDSEFWNLPSLSFIDTGLTPGSTHSYRIYVADPDGNTMVGSPISTTLPSINDTDAGIVYSGAWYRSANRGAGDYQDDVSYTYDNGASATVTFSGTAISLITEKFSTEGTATVTVDSGPPTTINLLSTQLAVQQVVFTANGLPAGKHTLTITKTGGQVLPLDAVAVTGTILTGAKNLTLSTNAVDFGLVLPGSHKNLSITISNPGTVDVAITSITPPAAPFTLTAPLAAGAVVPAGGSITVGLTYAPTAPGSNHGVFAVVADDGAGPRTVNLQGVSPSAQLNDTNAGIVYSGAWYRSANRGAGDYQDDVSYTYDNGASATVTFSGTAISLITEKFSTEGTATVTVDSGPPTTINLLSTQLAVQQVVFTANGLPAGKHTLTITKTGGQVLPLDAVAVTS